MRRTPSQEQVVLAIPIATEMSEMTRSWWGGEPGVADALFELLSKCAFTAGLQMVVITKATVQQLRWIIDPAKLNAPSSL
jgi:hypothetical protein